MVGLNRTPMYGSGGSALSSQSTGNPQPTASPQATPTPQVTSTPHPNQPAWLTRTDGTKYHVTENLNLTYGTGISKVSCILPLPQSSQYQDLGPASYYDSLNSAGNLDSSVKITVSPTTNCSQEILEISKTKDIYSRFLIQDPNPLSTVTRNYVFTLEYDITLYTVKIDFNKITTIYSYNQNTELYTNNTGKDGDQKGYHLDPSHQTIQSTSNILWSQAQGNYLQYARLCYDWVSSTENFTYGNPGIGFRYMDDIMTSRVCDCGNLSSVFISLLRAQGIPSHHLVLIRPHDQSGPYHAYAEFYLENYGWLPVDVTYKLGNHTGDYFGKVEASHTGAIVSSGVNLDIDTGLNGIQTIRGLQTYTYSYIYASGSSAHQNPVLDFSFSGTKI